MARTILDTQLHEIRTRIIRLGTLVATALQQALQAVQSGDQALCGLVIASDSTIDGVRSEAEQLAFQSLTLQQPLAGQDLRFLSSAPSIVGDLERMGDNAAGVAKLLLRMAPLGDAGTGQVHIDASTVADRDRKGPSDHVVTEASIVSGIVELGQEARRQGLTPLPFLAHLDGEWPSPGHGAREIVHLEGEVEPSQLLHRAYSNHG